ncbi:MAG: hypothetical protein M3132_12100 [Actinomycetia bacterium]|nr:hypothetical protein [Actinomycetes bacterium]
MIIVLMAILVSRQTDERGAVEFFAAAEDASTLHDEASVIFGEVFSSIGVVSRQDLTRRLDAVTSKATEASSLLDIEVPSVVGVPYGTIVTASNSWMDGSIEVDRVIVGIMDGEIVSTAVSELQHALDQMRVGDVAYEQFIDSVASEDDTANFSPIVYVETDPTNPLKYNATNLVLRIQSAYALAPHRDVSVLGMTDPEAVGDRDGIPLVPSSDTIGVTALVNNEGNEDEPSVAITLEIFNADTGESSTLSDVVTDLKAGSSTTVMFPDLDIVKGSLYQVTLAVTINGDILPDNNEWEMKFIWNTES